MDPEQGSGKGPEKVSTTLILAVAVVVFLAIAGVIAMVVPTGDQGQSKDPGTPVEIPEPSPDPQGAPVIEATADASLEPEGDDGYSLVCTFRLPGVPNSRSTVVHILAKGSGVDPVPLLHPGEEASNGTVTAGADDPETFVAAQDIGVPQGQYSCELAAVMTASGAAELEGKTRASVSA